MLDLWLLMAVRAVLRGSRHARGASFAEQYQPVLRIGPRLQP